MDKSNEIVVSVIADTTDIENKLQKIKKLLDDIKISIKEVKKLF